MSFALADESVGLFGMSKCRANVPLRARHLTLQQVVSRRPALFPRTFAVKELLDVPQVLVNDVKAWVRGRFQLETATEGFQERP